MRISIIALVGLFCLNVINGYCQSEIDKDYSVNIDLQTPNASSLAKIAELPIDYYNGTVTTTIPVFSDKENDIPINLSLIYNSSGLKVEEIPSWVGLGWTLNVGGVITRSLSGLPDESSFGILTGDYGLALRDHSYALLNLRKQLEVPGLTQSQKDALNEQASQHVNYLKDGNDGDYDIGHDMFSITLPEGSATFYFVPENKGRSASDPVKVMFKEDVNWVVEYSIGDISSGSLSVNDVIVKFIITTSSNTKYYFEKPLVTKINNNNKPDQNIHTNAWYLTRVESGTSNAIVEYKYKSLEIESIWQSPISTEIRGWVTLINHLDNTEANSTVGQSSFSSQEIQHHVIFLDEISFGNNSLKFFSTKREDEEFPMQEKLNSIQVIKNQKLIQEIQFETSYFNNNGVNMNLWNHGNVYGYKKLKLDGITFQNDNGEELNKYSLSYNQGNIPHYLSFGKDAYGYYNGIDANNNAGISRVPQFKYHNLYGAPIVLEGLNMKPNAEYSKIGMLKSIIYPMGARIEFEYEPNTYDYSNIYLNNDGFSIYDIDSEYSNIENTNHLEEFPFETINENIYLISNSFQINKVEATQSGQSVNVAFSIEKDGVFSLQESVEVNIELIKIDNNNNNIVCRTWENVIIGHAPVNIYNPFDIVEGNYKIRVKKMSDANTLDKKIRIKLNWTSLKYIVANNELEKQIISSRISGNRVYEIKYINPLEFSENYIKKIQYSEERDGIIYSTGKLERMPAFNFYGFAESANNGNQYPLLYRSIIPLTSAGYAGNHSVGYSKVIETTIINNNYHYDVIHQFSNESDEVLSVIDDPYIFSGTLKNITDKSIYRGNLISSESFNSNNTKVSEKKNIYDIKLSDVDNNIPKIEWRFLKFDLGGNTLTDDGILGITKINGYVKKIKTVENHQISDLNDVFTKEEYHYKSKYNLLDYKEVFKGGELYLKQEYEYAFEQNDNFISNGVNAIDFPIKITNKDKNGNFISGKKYEWNINNNKISLQSIYVNEKENILLKKSEINYDGDGRPYLIESPNNFTKKVIWSKNDKWKPIATSSADEQSNNVYTTSFSLDGLTGWQPAEYQNENRLVFRKDKDDLNFKEYKKSLVGELNLSYVDKVVFEFDFVASSFPVTSSRKFFFRASENGVAYNKGVQFHVYDQTFYTLNRQNLGVSLLGGLVAGKTYAIKIIVDQATDKADYYIDGVKRGSAIELLTTSSSPINEVSFLGRGNTQEQTNYYVDNFRMYKYGAQVQSAELSKLDGRITSLKSSDGLTTRFGYDSFGRLVDSRTETGPVTKQFYSYGDLANDNTAAPYVETIVLSERRPISVFSTSSWNSVNSSSFGHYLSNEDEYVIKQTNISNKTNGSISLSSGEQFWIDLNVSNLTKDGVSYNLYFLNSRTSKRFYFRFKIDANNTPNPSWTFLDQTGSESQSVPIPTTNKNGWYSLQFERRTDGYLKIVIRDRGGKQIAEHISSEQCLATDNIKIVSDIWNGSGTDQVYLARPILAKNVISTIEYTDGLGRPVQSHTVAADKRMVSATYLDGKGNAVASIKPVELNNQSGFLSFATVFGSTSWEPGQALSGSSVLKTAIGNAGYSADAAYAYSRTAFEKSPLNRVEKQFNPGESGLNSTTQVSSTYGINASAITFTALNVTFAANTLTFTTLTDQEGKSSTSYQDGLGREVLRVVDMDSNLLNVSNTDLVTLFEYDGLGNLLKSVDPKGLSTVYRYNPLGQLVSKKLPDMTDSVHYRYDNMGNLRFVQQPNHRLISPNANQTYYVNVPASPKNIQANGTHGILYLSMESFGDPIQTNVKEGDKTVASYLVASEELYSITSLVSSDVKVEVTNNENLTTIRYNPFKYTYNKYDEFGRITETGEYYGSTMFESAEANLSDFPTTDRQPLVKYYYDEKSAVSGANVSTGNLAKVEYFLNHDVSRKGITSYSYNSQGLVEWIKQEIPRGESAMLTSEIRYSYRDDGLLIKKQIVYGATNLYQWFYYDSFNRLVKASSNTSDNAEQATTDVDYSYDALGQLKAKVIRSGVQQVDYSYDIRGWLKAINDPNTIGTDKFAQSMVYMKNGNIGSISYSQPTVLSVPKLTFNYGYDNAGRLTSAYQSSTNMYKSTYSYDKNGNITKIGRAPQNEFIADLYLSYPSNSNRLEQIYDDEQGEDYSVSHDSQGNLIRNEKKGINSISYDGRNLAYLLVTSTGVHKYQQDGSGNRVIKDYNGTSVLYYLRDGEGRVQAVFNKDGQLLFWNLYAGSELLGKRNP